MSADDPWRGCNPLDPAFRDDPYPSLRRLREVEPANLTPIGFWRLTRYADVNRLLHEVPAGTRTTDGVLPRVDGAGDVRPRGRRAAARDARAGRCRRDVARRVLPGADRGAADAPRRRSPERPHPRRGGGRPPEPIRAHLAGDRPPHCRLRDD